MTPSARSKLYLRNAGFIVAGVEQRLPIPGKYVTRDAFGFGDMLVAKPGFGVALVQTTSATNLSARQSKSIAIPELRAWLASGGRFLLHGWSLRGARGERKTWQVTEREIKIGANGEYEIV